MIFRKGLCSYSFLLFFAIFLGGCASQTDTSPKQNKVATENEKRFYLIHTFQGALRPWENQGGYARIKSFRDEKSRENPNAIWGVWDSPSTRGGSSPIGVCSEKKLWKDCQALNLAMGVWKSENEWKSLLAIQANRALSELQELQGFGVEILEIRIQAKNNEWLGSTRIHLDQSVAEDSTIKTSVNNILNMASERWKDRILPSDLSSEVNLVALKNWSLQSLQKMGKVQGIVLPKDFVKTGLASGPLTQENFVLSFPQGDDDLVGADLSQKQIQQIQQKFDNSSAELFGSLWKSKSSGKFMTTAKFSKELERQGIRFAKFRFGATLEAALKAELKRHPPQ